MADQINAGLAEQTPGQVLDFLQMLAQQIVLNGQGSLPTQASDGTVTVNGSSAVLYFPSFLLPRNVTFGWLVDAASVGTVALVIELEQGWKRPTTEGASDATWAVPDNKLTTSGLFPTIADANAHITAYSPDSTPFARIKVSGASGNNAATKLTALKAYAIKNSLA